MMTFRPALLPLTMPLVLAACLGNGGGGGGSGSSSSLPSFTSFPALEPNAVVVASTGSSVNYAADVDGGFVDREGDITVQSSSLRIQTGDQVEQFSPEFEALRLTVNVPEGRAFVRDFVEETDSINFIRRFDIVDEEEQVTDRLHVVADIGPPSYTAYGIWEVGIGGESVDMGGAAWGALTPTVGDGSMPTGGTVGYRGFLLGHNVRDDGTTAYVARSELVANFDDDTVTFSSNFTAELGNPTNSNPGLDIVGGEGEISGNGFSGMTIDLRAAVDDNSLSFDGSFGGNFFGPEAVDAGGWFEVTNTDNNDRYFGSFGAMEAP